MRRTAVARTAAERRPRTSSGLKIVGGTEAGTTRLAITPPNFQSARILIEGTAPFVMNKMSGRVRDEIIRKQEMGTVAARKGRALPPKNFNEIYLGTIHNSVQGWPGIPCSAFRAGLISACKLVGFHMTRAKLALFVVADGFDDETGEGLVKLEGKPTRRDMPVKQADGSTTIMPRAFFNPWKANVTLRWDGDMFTAADIINLMSRMGEQVGVGAGRNDSKNSTGMGWGSFVVRNNK